MILKKWATTIVLLVVAFVGFQSCEEEPSAIGSGLVDEVNFNTFSTDKVDVVAYSQRFPQGFQTNGIGVGALGIYKDEVFGTLKTEILSQVALSRNNPNFGEDTVLDSVVITLPYFATVEETDEEGNTTYSLDSIFGSSPMKLSMFRSNYFLNNLNPEENFEVPAIYYNNDINDFPGIEGDLLFEDAAFFPSNEEIVLVTTDGEGATSTERSAPALRKVFKSEISDDDDLTQEELMFNNAAMAYWKEVIIDKVGQDVLLNQNLFREYFRGIYFKVEPINGDGHYFIFDYDGVGIELFYSFKGDDDSGEPGESTNDGLGSISIDLGGANATGVQVLSVGRTFTPEVEAAFLNPNTVDGEENLYIGGGDVSLAIIDLFGPRLGGDANVQVQLDLLRSCGIIINEANLVLNVNQELMGSNTGTREPERIFIYDIDNNRTLIDLASDTSVGNFGPVDSDINHLGRLEREVEDDLNSPGTRYKIRLTQHINDIINNDSTNVRLAVAVTQNVGNINTALVNDEMSDISDRQRIPVASVIAPESTIIHGNLSPDADKRLKLNILYTLPDANTLSDPCKEILGID